MRSEKEINDVLNEVCESLVGGDRRFPGMSYEDGVDAALRWVTGDTDEHPYPAE